MEAGGAGGFRLGYLLCCLVSQLFVNLTSTSSARLHIKLPSVLRHVCVVGISIGVNKLVPTHLTLSTGVLHLKAFVNVNAGNQEEPE